MTCKAMAPAGETGQADQGKDIRMRNKTAAALAALAIAGTGVGGFIHTQAQAQGARDDGAGSMAITTPGFRAAPSGGNGAWNHVATQDIDMSGYRITNMATPDLVNPDPRDAATVEFVRNWSRDNTIWNIFAGTGIKLSNPGNSPTISLEKIIVSGSEDREGAVWYNGTRPEEGMFHGGSATPEGSVNLNWNGNFRARDMRAFGNVTAEAYFHSSDERLKTDIEDMDGEAAFDGIMQLRPVLYSWIESGRPAMGLIAQEVREVFPNAVHEDEGGMLAIDYPQLIAPIITAMHQMDEILLSMQDEQEDLRMAIFRLEARIAALAGEDRP